MLKAWFTGILITACVLPALAQNLRPYDQVIPKDAVTRAGVFKTHQLKSKLYYEIPRTELDKDFLWMVKIAKNVPNLGGGNGLLAHHVVQWNRRDDHLLLRTVPFGVVANSTLPIFRAVEAANQGSIVMSFLIEAMGPDESPVIDVTNLFAAEVPEASARGALKAQGFDQGRSFIERVVAFPRNIEVEATHTYTKPIDSPFPAADSDGLLSGMLPGSATVLIHHSMVKLPEAPMMPRLADSRVGYMDNVRLDYGQNEYRAPQRRFVSRWRLERKEPGESLSAPVKPIEIWIDPATPASGFLT